MSTHTRGPWTIEQATDGRRKGYIRGPKSNGAGGRIAVARVSEAGNGPSEQAANARLIAAAPDLLEALRQIREAVCSGMGTLPADDIERAEAAIRLAEGRQ